MSTTTPQNCPQCGTPLPAHARAGLCPRCVMEMNLAAETEFTGEAGPQGLKGFKQPPSPEELASKFPQLEILELLGRGGMGAVYKARQKELDRIVALKILPPGIGDDPAFAERFSREAKALAKLHHPNIVTLFEFGRADGLFFFLMEFVDGITLRQLLETGRVAPREALAIVPQICDALQFAHDQGIVHRDIKPENILMDRRGRVKVADFGLAKLVSMEGGARHSVRAEGSQTEDGAQVGTIESLSAERTGVTRPTSELTDAGKIMGTPQYMAPEQRDKPLEVDHRADIYALGVVFYQMLTGELPGKRIVPPSTKVQIDVRLDEIVLRALEKNPDLRYHQASFLKTQIETVAAGNAKEPGAAKTLGIPAWKITASLCSLFFFGGITLGTLVIQSLQLGGWAEMLFFWVLFLALPVVAFALRKPVNRWRALTTDGTPAGRGWFLGAGIASSLVGIVVVGFAIFFLFAMIEDTSGWNPHLKEAIFVISTFIGAILLPASAWILFKAAKPIDPSIERKAIPTSSSSHESDRGGFSLSVVALITGLLVAVIWGYFSDLQHGQVGWFLGRLVLVLVTLLLFRSIFRAVRGSSSRTQRTRDDQTSSITVQRKRGGWKWALLFGALLVIGTTIGSQLVNRIWASRAKAGLIYQADLEFKRILIEREITYSGVKFEHSPVLPRVLVTFDQLHVADGSRNGQGRWLNGALHLTFDNPEVCFIRGFGDLADVQHQFLTPLGSEARWPRRVGAAEDEQFVMDEQFAIASPSVSKAPRAGSIEPYGIPMQKILESISRSSGPRFMDLDTITTVDPPSEYSGWSWERKKEWVRDNGIDLMVTGNSSESWSLWTPAINETRWTPPDAYAAGSESRKGERLQMVDYSLEIIELRLQKIASHLDHRFVFETANGTTGILQVLEEVLSSGQHPIGLLLQVQHVRGPKAEVVSGAQNGSGVRPKTEFAATLSDGSFVELITLGYGGGSNPRRTQGPTNEIVSFWKPDGTEYNLDLGWGWSMAGVSAKRIPGLENRGAVVHWGGPSASNPRLMSWQLGGSDEENAFGQFNVTPPKGEGPEHWLGFVQGYPSDQKTATMRFALASGPYQTGDKPNFVWSSSDKTPYGNFSIGQIFDHNGNAAVTLAHNLKECDYRLRTTIDTSPKPKSALGGLLWEWKQEFQRGERYKPVYGRMVKSGGMSGQNRETYEFPGVPAKEAMAALPKIYFEVRPIQWVEFQNVALNPGEEADVQIRINEETELPATNPVVKFGPIVERVVPSLGTKSGNQGLSFETGAQFTVPEGKSLELLRKWLADHGVDLVAVNKGDWKWNLVGLDFKVAPVPEEQWDKPDLQVMTRALDVAEMINEDGFQLYYVSNEDWPFHPGTHRPKHPLTFALQVGTNRLGVLQLTPLVAEPPAVKVRYKLMERNRNHPPLGPAPSSEWKERIAAMNTMSWRQAYEVAKPIAALPPSEGLAVVREHWTTLTNAESRQQLHKAFWVAEHPHLVPVLELSYMDEALLVQEGAFWLLREVALQDFSEDYNAGKAWLAEHREMLLTDVLARSARDAARRLSSKDIATVERQLKWMRFVTVFRNKPEAVDGSGLDEALKMIINGADPKLVESALQAAVEFVFSPEWYQEVVLPRIQSGNSQEVRAAALTVLSVRGGEWAATPLLRELTNAISSSNREERSIISNVAGSLGSLKAARAIPTMIAVIEADNTYDTVYGVGYFGLSKLTGVKYDGSHNGAWWREWWEKNKQRYPAEIQALEIPRLTAAKLTSNPRSSVAEVASLELLAGGDTNKLFYLIGQTNLTSASPAGFRLLLVLPGGDGGRNFHPFVNRISQNSLPDGYLVAQLVAPKWDEKQFEQLVWPTEKNRYPGMKFSTEQFIESVIEEVSGKLKIDSRHIYTLSWSSGGPAAYAVSLAPQTRVKGSFVAMSVFKPNQLPDLKAANGHRYYILHSPEDFIPLSMAETARDLLKANGAATHLATYEGGHGWHGNVFGNIRRGLDWLEEQMLVAESASTPQSSIPSPTAAQRIAIVEEAHRAFQGKVTVFSPIVERTLQSPSVVRTNAFIDFDTGEVSTPPAALDVKEPWQADMSSNIWNWATTSGVDALADTSEQVRGLRWFGVSATRVPDSEWENGTAQSIEKAVNKREAQSAFHNIKFPAPGDDRLQAVVSANTLSTHSDQSRTFAFRTGGKRLGILQLVQISDEPRGFVKFRYKLVQASE